MSTYTVAALLVHRNLINGVYIDLGGFAPLNHMAVEGLLSKVEENTSLIVPLAGPCTQQYVIYC